MVYLLSVKSHTPGLAGVLAEKPLRQRNLPSNLGDFSGLDAAGAHLAGANAPVFRHADLLQIGQIPPARDAGCVQADPALALGQTAPRYFVSRLRGFPANFTCS